MRDSRRAISLGASPGISPGQQNSARGATLWWKRTNMIVPSSIGARSLSTTTPRTVIINNLEYDHADIFPDLKAIQDQFHLLLRTIPSIGEVVSPRRGRCHRGGAGPGLLVHGSPGSPGHGPDRGHHCALAPGLWSPERRAPRVHHEGVDLGPLILTLSGRHNAQNALAAIAAAHHVGVAPAQALEALRASMALSDG